LLSWALKRPVTSKVTTLTKPRRENLAVASWAIRRVEGSPVDFWLVSCSWLEASVKKPKNSAAL
jgi:hypothetical protein